MDLARLAGAPIAAMVKLEERIDFDPGLRELVRLRASLINGCAFCIDMHWTALRRDGESEVRLAQLAAWEESPFFDERERAALALTDAVTHVSATHVPDAVWARAEAHFPAEELSHLLFAIAAINLWNRLAVSVRGCPRATRRRPRDSRAPRSAPERLASRPDRGTGERQRACPRHRGAFALEREGQARAGLGTEASELAAGVRSGVTDRERLLDELRPVSFAIAYRMLGSVSEAEDVVQEALLRVHRALEDGDQIQSPHAFVATVTTRLAINELRSARARREQYVGEWLPEPIITDGSDDLAQHAEMADSLSLAMLVLLESLSPEQRAVLLLHDVFDYDHAQIARIIGKSQDNVRQLATRARRHVEQRRPRFQTTREQREELARRFFQAAEQGDLAGLEALLAHDVVLTGDGGGKAPALARSLRGRNRVARTLIDYWTKWDKLSARIPRPQMRPTEINGSPGALVLDGSERVIGVVVLDIGRGQIQGISSILNPDKLAHLGPTANLGSLLRTRARAD